MKKVSVVIDYQNIHLCGWDAYTDRSLSPYASMINPVLFAQTVVKRIDQGDLAHITVCRGMPDQSRASYWYDREQARMWRAQADNIGVPCTFSLQQMTYRDDGSIQEKSVDIDCALRFVEDARNPDYDITVLCTHDVDFRPALQLVADSGEDGRQAVWTGGKNLTFYPMQYKSSLIQTIPLTIDDWISCIDHTNWSYALDDMPDAKSRYEKMMEDLDASRHIRMRAVKNIAHTAAGEE